MGEQVMPGTIWAWEIDNETIPPNGYYATSEVDDSVEYVSRDFADQKPLRMLSDLYCRFAKAARNKDEFLMRRLAAMIEDFRWAWPLAAAQHDERYYNKST